MFCFLRLKTFFTTENRRKKKKIYLISTLLHLLHFFRKCPIYNFQGHRHSCAILLAIFRYYTVTATYKFEQDRAHTMLSINCPATWEREILQGPKSKIWWWKWRKKNRKEIITEEEERCKIVGTAYSN